MADAVSTFAAKDAGFTSTLNKMQKSLASFQGGMDGFGKKLLGLAAGFVSVQQSVAAFNNALAMGGRLDDLSKTTGASAGELLLLEKAFSLAGSSADAVGPTIARLSRFMVEASNGGAAQIETMNKLGLSYSQLKDLTPTEQMRLLAKSIMALPTPAERTAAAMDIFGRSGSTLIPLFANFSGELDKAQGYLGSLPGLLDESAGAMADMEDDLGALGDKFNQFVAGLVAGAAGADNFASALAKIDTAGIGAGLGEQLRVAFDAPLQTAKAIGYTLLTGAKVAGNALINATAFSAEMFVKTISAKEYAIGLGERIRAALMEAVNAFNKILAYGVEKIFLQPLSNLPGIIGDPFRAALDSVQDIQKTLDATSRENFSLWNEGGEKIKRSINNAKNSTEILSKDWLGVEQSAADAARHMIDAQDQSRQIREDSEATAANYGEGSAAIRDALNDIRGFDLKEQMGPEKRPDWTQSDEAPPKSAPAPAPSRGAGGSARSSASAPRPQSALDRLRQSAQDDPRARAEMFRIQNEQSRAMDRAGTLREGGMFRSAANAEIRGERRAEQRAENFRAREIATERFGGRNTGEAFRNFREMMSEQGVFGSNQQDFEKWAKEQAKSEKERQAQESSGATPSKDGSKPTDPMQSVVSKMDKIIAEIMERLPQNALSYN
jgi:hypothetical protein